MRVHVRTTTRDEKVNNLIASRIIANCNRWIDLLQLCIDVVVLSDGFAVLLGLVIALMIL